MNTPAASAAASPATLSSAPAERTAPRWLRIGSMSARLLLGAALLVFGLNGFLNFIPPPEAPLPEPAMAFAGALLASGYMFPLISITFLLVGFLLVINRWVPLALILFAPFLVNSVAFHVFLERSGLPTALVFVALELFLAWHHRAAYRPLFSARFQTGD